MAVSRAAAGGGAEFPGFPEYHYPWSCEGALESRIDAFADTHPTCDVSALLNLLKGGKAGVSDCGVRMNPRYFRAYYPRPEHGKFFNTHWAGEVAEKWNGYPHQRAPGIKLGETFTLRYGQPLLRGGAPTWTEPQPYHCPYGWRRFAFEVPNFKAKQSFAIAYHGTSIDSVGPILSTFLRPGKAQEGGDGHCAYLSPSIEYAACPRYASTLQIGKKQDRSERFVQVVLQMRVQQPTFTQAETLGATYTRACPGGWASRPWGQQAGGRGRAYPVNHKVYDPHFRNAELEWLYSENELDLRESVVPGE